MAVLVALVLFGVYWIKQRVMRSRSRTTSSGAQRILLSFLQVVALVTSLRTRAPAVFTGVGQAASGLGDGVSLELFPVDCALGLGFYAKLYIYAFLPFICFLVSGAIVFCCCAPCGRCKTKPLGKLVLSRAAAAAAAKPAGGPNSAKSIISCTEPATGSKPLASKHAPCGEGSLWQGQDDTARLGGVNPMRQSMTTSSKQEGSEKMDESETAAEALYEIMLAETASQQSDLKTYLDLWVAVGVVLVFLVYSRVFRALVDVFTIYPFQLEGSLRLQADLTVAANTPEHSLATAVAGIALLAYAFGIPISMVIVLFRNHKRLYPMTQSELDGLRERGELTAHVLREAVARNSFFTRFSFTYDGTRPGLFWWETVVLSRKVLISLTAALIQSPVMQAIGAASVLALALALQLLVKPYALYGLNALEAVSLTTSLAILFGSTLYWRMDQDLGQGLISQDGFDARETTLTIVLLVLLLLALVLLLGSMAGKLSVKVLAACCGGETVEACLNQVDSACRHRSMRKRVRGAAVPSVLRRKAPPGRHGGQKTGKTARQNALALGENPLRGEPARRDKQDRAERPVRGEPARRDKQDRAERPVWGEPARRDKQDRAERPVWGATPSGKPVVTGRAALSAVELERFRARAAPSSRATSSTSNPLTVASRRGRRVKTGPN
jgi:hypothetical protein